MIGKTSTRQAKAAKAFAIFWKDRGYEKGESQPFWIGLLRDVLEVEQPETYITFEDQVKLDRTSFIDGHIRATHVLIEQKSIGKNLRAPIRQSDGSMLNPFQQAKRYAAELPYSERPRWIVTCNFKSFLVYDMERPNGEPEEILLENLEKEYYRLSFLVETVNVHLQREMEISLKAGEIIGEIYDALLKQYADVESDETLRSLNVLCVRLVFCLYAEDAGLFGSHSQFHDYLAKYKPGQGEMREALIRLFNVLNTPEEKRDRYMADDLAAFPYCNGGLFADKGVEIPRFNDEIAHLLLKNASSDFDWSEISPTIFGSVFESTLNPDTRRSGGMHYTSIENIHKLIDVLFLDDLKLELDRIKSEPNTKTRTEKAKKFQEKLSALTFLDPSCGSGNFLTETYLSLRRLENEAILLYTNGQVQMDLAETNPVKVSIHQFYGIEINDFAVDVATTALWIAESQMLRETEKILDSTLSMLPLKTYHNIRKGNALRLSWTEWQGLGNRDEGLGNRDEGLGNRDEGLGISISDSNLTTYKNYDSKLQGFNCMAKSYATDGKNVCLGENITQRGNVCAVRSNETCSSIDSVQHCRGLREEFEERIYPIPNDSAGICVRIGNANYISSQNRLCDRAGMPPDSESSCRNQQNDQFDDCETEVVGCVASNPLPLTPNPSYSVHFDYIMGNPPFVGARLMSKNQKEDMLNLFGKKWKNIGNMDYVSCWYYKASQVLKHSPTTRAALVSTNSVTQGEQVANLWKPLTENFGIHIDFAYRTFRWDSESTQKAHVHCVIVGFSCNGAPFQKRIITDSGLNIPATNINGYLIDAPDVFVESRTRPICDVPAIGIGNQPIDGGNYLFTKEEMHIFVKKEPMSIRWFRKWIGAEEFINGWYRYCLWLGDCTPNELRSMSECYKRVQAVRSFRMKSSRPSTLKLADNPTRFQTENMPASTFIAIPETSSEKRKYIPIGFLEPEVLCSNAIRIMPDATLYHFGILTSNVHNAWMRAVGGRLKSDYRYSKDIVYNNFPWPEPTDEQKTIIERTAQAILDARNLYPDSSLADLYDEVTMPLELRRAHQENDRAVMNAYGFTPKMTESQCVAELMRRYADKTALNDNPIIGN